MLTMKTCIRSLLLLILVAFVVVLPLYGAVNAKPNVVFILVDDLGWSDIGCYGSTFYETPNVDSLASEGMRFTDAYAASPVCSPTRASIMTGKYPHTVGFVRACPIENLALEEVTLAEALKEGGYRTAHIGKWHLQKHGEKGKAHYPEEQGFDVNIAGHTMGQPGSFFYPYKSERHPSTNVPDLEGGKPGEFLTDRLTDEAIGFIESDKLKPFFLSMWYYAVHTPVMGKEDKIEKYEKKALKMGLTDKEAAVAEHDGWSHKNQDNPKYAALIESMDENVGRIMKALEKNGMAENTIVIFMSDNGGLSTGSGKKAPTSCLPLRAGKAWVYEGGIRVPMIIKWPGMTKPGMVSNVPVISTDFYPTILDMVGLPKKPEQHVDGLSLAGLLKGGRNTLNRDTLYFHYPQDHHINSMGPSGAIRVGDYKLVERYSNMEVELYNLKDDLGEQNDLSKELPEMTEKLKNMLHEWRVKTGALLSNKL